LGADQSRATSTFTRTSSPIARTASWPSTSSTPGARRPTWRVTTFCACGIFAC